MVVMVGRRRPFERPSRPFAHRHSWLMVVVDAPGLCNRPGATTNHPTMVCGFNLVAGDLPRPSDERVGGGTQPATTICPEELVPDASMLKLGGGGSQSGHRRPPERGCGLHGEGDSRGQGSGAEPGHRLEVLPRSPMTDAIGYAEQLGGASVPWPAGVSDDPLDAPPHAPPSMSFRFIFQPPSITPGNAPGRGPDARPLGGRIQRRPVSAAFPVLSNARGGCRNQPAVSRQFFPLKTIPRLPTPASVRPSGPRGPGEGPSGGDQGGEAEAASPPAEGAVSHPDPAKAPSCPLEPSWKTSTSTQPGPWASRSNFCNS
jgi:hypothetical protein